MLELSKIERYQRKNRNSGIRTFDNIFKSVGFVENFFQRYPKSKLTPKKVYNNNLGWFVRGFNKEYGEAVGKLKTSFEQDLGNKDLEAHLKIVLGIKAIKDALHLIDWVNKSFFHASINIDTYSYDSGYLGEVLGLLFSCIQEGLISEAFTFTRESSQEIYLIYEKMAEELKRQFPDADLRPIKIRIITIAKEIEAKNTPRSYFLVEIADLFG